MAVTTLRAGRRWVYWCPREKPLGLIREQMELVISISLDPRRCGLLAISKKILGNGKAGLRLSV